MMFFLIFQNIVVGTPVCQYATAEFHCWYTGGPIRGERVNIQNSTVIPNENDQELKNSSNEAFYRVLQSIS